MELISPIILEEGPVAMIQQDRFRLLLCILFLGLRVIVWVILYLLEHTGEDFQSEILLVAQTVSPSLDHPNLIIKTFDKA